jgi:hypothetical protein
VRAGAGVHLGFRRGGGRRRRRGEQVCEGEVGEEDRVADSEEGWPFISGESRGHFWEDE